MPSMLAPLSVHDWWSVGLGLGLAPVAPGTMGTFLGVLIAVISSFLPIWWQYALVVVLTSYSIWAATRLAKVLSKGDPAVIVSDEVVGYLWSVLALPCTCQAYVLAFIFFRFFDILKPGPIRWLDNTPWLGFSIVADDVVAGWFANGTVHGIFWLFF